MDYDDEEMSYEEIKNFLDKHNIKAKVLDPDWAEFFNATCERYRKWIITNKWKKARLTMKADNDRLTLRERLILRILLFIVDWLARGCEEIHTFEIDRILEEFGIKEKQQWQSIK